ncbi:hypothetical protein [Actinotalea sp. C106]|uniref:hypothetical protein n=1 Tax=Actinotalea sp. C106 TaxID=2908644 RepID=UPI0020278EFA|nr:hypothetical protein [Actinotalea sp. C106]
MTWSEVAVLVVAVVLALAWWLWAAANRLDRLHRKVAATRATLENQLVRRASVAAELAGSACLDPVSSVLVGETAWSALEAGLDLGVDPTTAQAVADGAVPPARDSVPRDLAESDLSRTLRTALADPEDVAELGATSPGSELLEALAAAWYRVELSRRFHNEAVAQAQRLRRKALVRGARLAGRAPMPETVEIDDTWPEALRRPGHQA